MSIFAFVAAAGTGFLLGGPLGLLLKDIGLQAWDGLRHIVRSEESQGKGALEDERLATRRVAFTIGVIALAAKMAKADGEVSRSEINAFAQVFDLPDSEAENVRRVYNLAKQSVSGFELYARQVAELFTPGAPVLEDLLDGLFHIGKADGAVSQPELDYLAQVAMIFGFDSAAFARLKAQHLGPDLSDPHTILGVTHDATPDAIRIAWRKLVRDHHPDRLQAEGLPPECVIHAEEKIKRINAAYNQLSKNS